jgi:hypothetical protein
MSPGTRMPGPGSGGSALFPVVGSVPNTRCGSGAGAHGGPAPPSAGLGALLIRAGRGGGLMAGRNGAPKVSGPGGPPGG